MSLPNTYTRLTYIESSGTQWIATGLSRSQGRHFDIGFKKLSSSGYIYGNDYLFVGADSYFLTCGMNIRLGTLTYNQDYDIHIDVVSGACQVKNNIDETIISSSSLAFDSYVSWTGTPSIFCRNSGEDMSSARLYYFKIYDDSNVLLRDFIPAKRNTDSVLGLYDLVNDVFYTNSGSGTFIGGTEIKTSVNPEGSGSVDISTSADKFVITATPNPTYSFTNWLLKGYTQLEYIESSGTQYIDTNVIVSSNTEIEADYQFTNTTEGDLFGSGVTGANRMNFGTWGSYFIYYCGGTYHYSKANDTNRHVVKTLGTGAYYIDNVLIGNTNQSYSNTTRTLYVFVGNYAWMSYLNWFSYAKLYSLKIKNDGILVRDFIPVIRHSDGAIGLLDKVNLKFYGNSGTGTFIGGNPV